VAGQFFSRANWKVNLSPQTKVERDRHLLRNLTHHQSCGGMTVQVRGHDRATPAHRPGLWASLAAMSTSPGGGSGKAPQAARGERGGCPISNIKSEAEDSVTQGGRRGRAIP
jgi:hypothetical protein